MTTFRLRTVRLRPAEQFRTELPVVLEPLELGGETYVLKPESPEAAFEINRAVSGTLFSLSFEVALEGACMRCLQPASIPIDVAGREYQAESADSDELRTPYLVEDRLDLSAWARDLVALALPEKILCREDCAGLCAGCGANLNREACTCPPVVAESRFAKLAELFAESREA
jgi:uncharacterized protein